MANKVIGEETVWFSAVLNPQGGEPLADRESFKKAWKTAFERHPATDFEK
jgi:hypothetical protein